MLRSFVLIVLRARNAINPAMAAAIESAIDRLEEDDDLLIGILAHNGPVFCAGADLKEIAAGNGAFLGTERGGFAGIVLRERTKPLIAAVDGHAVAGGAEVVLSCDLVVASTIAKFGIPEVKRSLVAAAGGLVRLPRVLPPNIAMELALTGDTLSAERAHHFGLVNELCGPGEVVAAAQALAEGIAANAPLAVRGEPSSDPRSTRVKLIWRGSSRVAGRRRAWLRRRTSLKARKPSSKSVPQSGKVADP